MVVERRPITTKPSAPFLAHKSRPTEQYIKCLFYGPYGAGKTTLAGSAQFVEGMKPILFIDAEAGEVALPADVDVVTVKKWVDVARVYEFLKTHCRLRDEVLAKQPGSLEKLQALNTSAGFDPDVMFWTVVLDSLTEMQTYLMYQLAGVTIGQSIADAPEQAERGEWRESFDLIQLMARSFRDLPMHVIVVCSEQEVLVTQDGKKPTGKEEEQRSLRIVKRISLPGKLVLKIQAFWGVVGYLEAKASQNGEDRRLWLQVGHDRFQAKNRLRRGVAYLDEPTMQDLFNLLKENPSADPATENRTARASSPTTGGPTASNGRPRPAQAPARSGAGAGGRVLGRAGGTGGGGGRVGG